MGRAMHERGLRRSLVGIVVSDRMAKTVSVRVERLAKDPRYHKYLRRYKKFLAHDEKGECDVGDRVRIVESRPLSKRKRWKVLESLAKAPRA